MLLDNALIIFVKYPQAGLVKTRLAKEIGKEKATFLYRLFVEAILLRTEDSSFSRLIFYTPLKRKSQIINWLDGYRISNGFYPQRGKRLGQRLSQAFKLAFQKGAKRVVAIGSDTPTLDKRIILEAFCNLENNSCVIGPSSDGGYYLMGLSSFQQNVFKGIDWSTEKVLKQTIGQLRRFKINYNILEPSFDIDSYRDILLLKKRLKITNKENLYGLGRLIKALDKGF